jgi:hypothetical protein
MTRANHSVKRYKTSLVVKGFLQEYGVDYDEAFALVAWFTNVRYLLQLLQFVIGNCSIDVKNAFLNGDITKEVYAAST